MKLIIEKHPEFTRLSNYFKTIEILADNMGVDIDDLLSDHHIIRSNSPGGRTNKVVHIARERARVFTLLNKGNDTAGLPDLIK